MRLCLNLFLFIAVMLLANGVNAQTLTEKLIAEDFAKLAQVARQKGDVVRGAILFHQGNINCAKCHRPIAEAERIGPDLSRMDQEVTDAFLVESILQPSKTIKMGYEPVVALTIDGQQLSGFVVEKNNDKIVLRSREDPDRLITITQDRLEKVRPGTKSTMPEGLANELKSRQQFLDLVRYVIDVKERGPSADQVVMGSGARRQLSPELSGLVLIQESNCVACHKSNANQPLIAPKQAPNLKWSGKYLNPEHMARFIADPHSIKPGTTMPNMLEHLEPAARASAAQAITHFIAMTYENGFQFEPIDVAAAARGAEVFGTVGCIACHSPRNENAAELTLEGSKPLGDLTQKYNVSGLVEFLENPLAVRPSGRMPKMQLTHAEAIDVANYLLQKGARSASQFEPNDDLFKQGKSLFVELKCASCHTASAGQNAQPASELALDKLQPERGCLSGESGNWPNFHFDEAESKSIRTGLRRYAEQFSSEQNILVSLQSFNCLACHERGDFGGVSSLRNPHFQTTNLNLGEQGRIPPTLSGVGAKLKPKWMRDVLVNGRVIRPYMKTRMPQYGEENIGHLVELFQKTDKLEKTQFASFDDQKEMRKMGLEMAGNKGLNCVACHTYKYKLSDTMPAVDLTEMSERLKKDWFYQYMLAPQKFSPNTVMPSFWPGGIAIRKDISGDPEFQIEALWQYLIDGRQAGTPRGVVREPLEIVVADEAQMLRRSYPGIGKRGIGVGYPGGVNIAYDAEQMRVAMIWNGKFADPGGVWTGQGSGNVRPMARPFNFAKGPELDNADHPWVVDDGRPPNHRFKGYALDATRRPTFRYVFEDVKVKDYFESYQDVKTQKIQLRRMVSFTSSRDRDDLVFRIASSDDNSIKDDGPFYLIDKQLRVFVHDQEAQMIETPDRKTLRVELDLKANKKQTLRLSYEMDNE